MPLNPSKNAGEGAGTEANAIKPSNMYPTCEMEEYASRRLRLVCVSAARLPPVMVAIETNTSSGTYTARSGYKPHSMMRSNMAHAAAFTATDMNPVTLVGAPSYASGAHWWNGIAAILKSSPTDVVSKAMIAIGSL